MAVFLLAFACAARAYDPPQNAAGDLGDTSWQLLRIQPVSYLLRLATLRE